MLRVLALRMGCFMHQRTALHVQRVRRSALTAAARSMTAAPASEPHPDQTGRVFSGIQPTGVPHLGNYLGAIKNWVALQPAASEPRTSALFCVVDLHALTHSYSPETMPDAVLRTTACLVACGLDPKRVVLFRQSDVRQHTELCWLLMCLTPLGWLERMTQFKQKSRSAPRGGPASRVSVREGAGLLTYPVLQAADVLLYRAQRVPVGEDQLQHIELARDIAQTFNHAFKAQTEVLKLPQPFFPPPRAISVGNSDFSRIMSLRDAGRKMSKSDPDATSRIELTDDADAIRAKIMRAKTDSDTGFSYDPVARPEKSNLLRIMAAVTDSSVEALATRYATSSAAQFKTDLADALVHTIVPKGKEAARLLGDLGYVEGLLEDGGACAREMAEKNMRHVRRIMGLAL